MTAGKFSVEKGKRTERHFSTLLSEKSGVKWFRTPHSGAYATSHNKNDYTGDITTDDPRWNHVHVECKAYKQFSVSMLFRKNGMLWKHIRKCECHPDWILLIRSDHKGSYALSNRPSVLMDLGCVFENEVRLDGHYTLLKIR